jgi:hypothetical protein
MKSETKLDTARKFMEENHFVKSMVIHAKNKTTFYPNVDTEKRRYFEAIIEKQKKSAPESYLLLYTREEYIYVYKKDKSIYICECNNNISVSQVKMEFNTFIEDSQKQGKFPKFLSSFFDN